MRRIIILVLLGLIFSSVSAQKIEINVQKKALSEVLIDLRDNYDFQLSFNNELLSNYLISLNKSFSSKDKTIDFLLRKLPLNYQVSNEVFLIFPEEKIIQYRIFGQIMDKESLEPLPFSHLTINNLPMATDEQGNFSFVSEDSTFRILASHLGYFVHDTIVNQGANQKLLLTAASTDLPEITVTDKMVQTFIKMGNQAGNVKLNHKIAGFLPTNNDNSVFELLRLQPGILAAGEQNNDLIIWGSYEGESQVLFDNITLWGLKNFYEDIGAVNPLVVKNIEVLKGGFDARYGDRVGGIVHITGKNGSRLKPTLNLTLNNITASGSYEQPIGKKSSLLLAFRQTYYNLFKDEQIKYATSNVDLHGQDLGQAFDVPSSVNLDVAPDYKFHDINFKFSTNWENGDNFSVSIISGEDRYSYDITTDSYSNAKKHKFEGNDQHGGSINYGKVWGNGNTSALSVSRSELDTRTSDIISITRQRTEEEFFRRDDRSKNNIREYRATLKNSFVLSQDQNFETGINYFNNEVDLKEDSLGINILHINSKADRIGYYFQNNLNINNGVSIKAGFLANYPLNLRKLYWEPRISVSLDLSEKLSFNGAWGLYKQFIAKSSVLSESGNYRYIWVGADEKDTPVLESIHYVTGGSYRNNGFTFSIEGYYKKTDGHTRYYKYRNEENISIGKSKNYGLDVFAKKDIGNHTLWISYTLSKTLENFDYFGSGDYRRALHDQRHEIKTAGLLALKPFYISANYIYGSGFPIYSKLNKVVAEPDYTRLDAAFIYKFHPKKTRCEVGILFHNILNRDNLTYESYEKIPLDQINSISVYTETVPTSVRLYFKITL